MILNIVTPNGEHYKVSEKGGIYAGPHHIAFPSNDWQFLGITHVKRSAFIPLATLSPEMLKKIALLWKNGRPQWTVRDLDHGTMRTWGNTHYHGIKSLYFTEN